MRINLDSQWFGDPRWRLAGTLAKENALLTRARIENIWHYCYSQRCEVLSAADIAIHAEWYEEACFAEILVKCRLAEHTEDGDMYRLKGITERIQFLLDQAERGKAGAEMRKKKAEEQQKAKQTPSRRQANAKQTLSDRQANVEQPLSLSPAPAPAPDPDPDQSPSQVPALPEESARARDPEIRALVVADKNLTPGSQVWLAYAAAYERRYGTSPLRNAKENALCKTLVERLGAEAPSVAAFYVTHNGRYYVERGHNLQILVTDVGKIRTEWATNTQMTSGAARAIDRQSTNDQAIAEFLRRKAQEGA